MIAMNATTVCILSSYQSQLIAADLLVCKLYVAIAVLND